MACTQAVFGYGSRSRRVMWGKRESFVNMWLNTYVTYSCLNELGRDEMRRDEMI